MGIGSGVQDQDSEGPGVVWASGGHGDDGGESREAEAEVIEVASIFLNCF